MKYKKSLFRQIIDSRKKYIWLLPSFLIISIFALYPIFETFLTSFQQVSRSGLPIGWAGISNYLDVFRIGKGIEVFRNTFFWTASCLVLTHLISIIIALVLNKSFPGRKIVRTLVLIPWASSQVVTALTWRWIYNYDYGYLNLLFRQIGLIEENVFWLGGIYSSWIAVIVVGVFVSIPFTAFVLLAGLQSIPDELYEAARVDGAGAWYRFKKISIPLLKPVITISVIINAMYTFNSFHIIYVVTGGGPAGATDIAVTYMHRLAFEMMNMGRAAAMVVVIFFILTVFSVIYIRLMSGERA